MRRYLLAIALGTTLTTTGARAQCQDAGNPLQDGGCGPAFTVTVGPLPSITGVPLLDIDAIVQDDGSIIGRGPAAGGTVLVTVRGPSAVGGGTLVLPDGGTDPTFDRPFTAPLSLGTYGVDAGVFTSYWDGGTSLFLGDNTITVTAVEPAGAQVVSAPQLVKLDLSFDGGSADAGLDGGSGGDAGVGPDGGVTPDGGLSTDAGQTSPDAGVLAGGGAGSSNTEGCSTAAGGPPSFLLMALAVMLAALGRRAMRG
jgi:uncharacterized protein (TIGR03382 family)